jgi:hypothetical protein
VALDFPSFLLFPVKREYQILVGGMVIIGLLRYDLPGLYIKRSLQNAIFTSKAEIRQHLDLGFARLRKRPDILMGLCHHAHLTLKQLW